LFDERKQRRLLNPVFSQVDAIHCPTVASVYARVYLSVRAFVYAYLLLHLVHLCSSQSLPERISLFLFLLTTQNNSSEYQVDYIRSGNNGIVFHWDD
jgi:hypothetical protein